MPVSRSKVSINRWPMLVRYRRWVCDIRSDFSMPPDQIDLVIRRATADADPWPRFLSVVGAPSIPLLTLIVLTVRDGSVWQVLAILTLVSGVVSVLFACLHRRLLRPYVWHALVDLGLGEVCQGCGYRLCDLPKESLCCPECGWVRYRRLLDDPTHPPRVRPDNADVTGTRRPSAVHK